MKRILIGLLLASVGMFYACQKEDLNGNNLIGQITASAAKVSVEVSELPAAVPTYVYQSALGDIEAAFHAPGLGYEVDCENGDQVYFDEGGNVLEGGPRHGRGGCLFGRPVSVDSLPAAITDYIAANYAGATVDKAVRKRGGFYVVKLTDGPALIFSADGEFVNVCEPRIPRDSTHRDSFPPRDSFPHRDSVPGGHPCLHGADTDVTTLAQSILDYVTANYAGTTIEKAATKRDGAIAVKLSDGTILIFNADGEFVNECERGRGPRGPRGGGNGPGGGHGPRRGGN